MGCICRTQRITKIIMNAVQFCLDDEKGQFILEASMLIMLSRALSHSQPKIHG